ncbi:uncharacterized protein B0P05DRAFT_527524 [Gilbertella persicaria]|uniref:Uncharacterized protein n=1 Tax=Rhizopus stolonifer TaxID=4846 RepID=A0A367KQL8_RHIST|nr:uncharacterized protein B0P05DRAFT_527524 [Gilbertella persicaria]KAI8091434.1 hypothetical protein B0P05DRAFT_527524 [Gilbertella persicaria]RCI04504.1 hypothetical protein CU098_012699 [Rhizopus stolonifer]
MNPEKKRAHHISAPLPPHFQGFNQSTSDSLFEDYPPPPAYQPPQFNEGSIPHSKSAHYPMSQFYLPQPAPQTVVVYRQPAKSKDACCWGCLAAICLCFGAKECCL